MLRGICIGAGYFADFHLHAWKRIDNVEIVGICESDAARAERAAATYEISRYYTDANTALNELSPDFVDIITPPATHLSLVQLATERRIAIICQKPLAPSLAEARQIVDLTHAAGVRLMVHENFRFQPWHREIKRLLNAGVIGDKLHTLNFRCRMGDGWQRDAYLARQPYFRQMPRLLVYETGIHFIDTFRFLAGEIRSVYASLRRLNDDIVGEDAGILLFEFESGTQGIWDANRFNEPMCENPRYTFGEFLVEGNGGSIRLDPDGQIMIQPLGEKAQLHEYAHSHEGFAGDCVRATQQHFVDALLTSGVFESSGHDYLRSLRVQEAAYQSAKTGSAIRLDYAELP